MISHANLTFIILDTGELFEKSLTRLATRQVEGRAQTDCTTNLQIYVTKAERT